MVRGAYVRQTAVLDEAENTLSGVRRAVIDDDHLEVVHVLSEHRLHGASHDITTLVGWNHHAHMGSAACLPPAHGQSIDLVTTACRHFIRIA